MPDPAITPPSTVLACWRAALHDVSERSGIPVARLTKGKVIAPEAAEARDEALHLMRRQGFGWQQIGEAASMGHEHASRRARRWRERHGIEADPLERAEGLAQKMAPAITARRARREAMRKGGETLAELHARGATLSEARNLGFSGKMIASWERDHGVTFRRLTKAERAAKTSIGSRRRYEREDERLKAALWLAKARDAAVAASLATRRKRQPYFRLTEAERAEYLRLAQYQLPAAERLRMVGRADLLPKPTARTMTPEEQADALVAAMAATAQAERAAHEARWGKTERTKHA